jgi:hypothetical protein
MIFWLFLMINGANMSALHVGNFKSMEECLNAAKDAQAYSTARTGVTLQPTYMCIQANGEGTVPPG